MGLVLLMPKQQRNNTMNAKQQAKQKAIAYLLSVLKPGQDVYAKVTYVARSGMYRRVSVYIVLNGEIWDITHHVAYAVGYTMFNYELNVAGYDFNAKAEVVYNLSSELWPKGTDAPHGTRNGEPDYSAGHALKQRDM